MTPNKDSDVSDCVNIVVLYSESSPTNQNKPNFSPLDYNHDGSIVRKTLQTGNVARPTWVHVSDPRCLHHMLLFVYSRLCLQSDECCWPSTQPSPCREQICMKNYWAQQPSSPLEIPGKDNCAHTAEHAALSCRHQGDLTEGSEPGGLKERFTSRNQKCIPEDSSSYFF